MSELVCTDEATQTYFDLLPLVGHAKATEAAIAVMEGEDD